MKLFPLAFSASLLAASAAFAQSAPVPSWYVALGTSVNFVEDSTYAEKTGTAPIRGTLETKDGYGITGALGYRPRNTGTLADNLRFEVEIGTRSNETDKFVSSGSGTITAFSEDVVADTLMANMYLDMNLGPNWRPYVGAGIGGARVKLESNSLNINDEDMVMAYQGMAGLYYTPTSFPAADIGLGYRYLGTSDPNFNINSSGRRIDAEYSSHSLEVGTRLYF